MGHTCNPSTHTTKTKERWLEASLGSGVSTQEKKNSMTPKEPCLDLKTVHPPPPPHSTRRLSGDRRGLGVYLGGRAPALCAQGPGLSSHN